MQDIVERRPVVNHALLRERGPESIEIVPVNRIHQLLELPIHPLPVGKIGRRRQKDIDGLIEFRPRSGGLPLLIKPLPGFKTLFGTFDSRFPIG